MAECKKLVKDGRTEAARAIAKELANLRKVVLSFQQAAANLQHIEHQLKAQVGTL